jgi:hypothetical protein
MIPNIFLLILQLPLRHSCGGDRDLRFVGGAGRESGVGIPFAPFAV